ncbi:PREDICTED: uncharacterized protein LOC108360189 [Rhagoletis zephyria]|uniref:uncharacterized protein LOC108360189 n=1 Tax=Rhagoletis zephyria TaxID=28612 RepID=UPI0008118FB9|nr:PREDICTED: uncharacterized protein LOC108360189 [Rhagoletis zephyria]
MPCRRTVHTTSSDKPCPRRFGHSRSLVHGNGQFIHHTKCRSSGRSRGSFLRHSHCDGTYIVEYPFKENSPPIHQTLQQACMRLKFMEKKFRLSPELKEQYTEFMGEYLTLGHMEKLSAQQRQQNTGSCFYLPHHAVFKPDSITTKCRVVFDGSSKDSSCVSLNHRLHVGPPIQRDLFAVSLRFRQHRFVFCVDIEKMFRGIRVSKEHTDFQKIVWRTDENAPIEHYRLLTVTHGLTSSPFLAVRVLKQLADDYKNEFPITSHVLINDVYVDDILTAYNSTEDLIKTKDELVSLLTKAKFCLRKWSSNCWPLLSTLPIELREYNPVDLNCKSIDTFVKVLGVQWNPCTDELSLKIKSMKCVKEPTKRSVLSEMSKIYDPLGIVWPRF